MTNFSLSNQLFFILIQSVLKERRKKTFQKTKIKKENKEDLKHKGLERPCILEKGKTLYTRFKRMFLCPREKERLSATDRREKRPLFLHIHI